MIVASDIRTLAASGLYDRPSRIAVHGCSLAAIGAICQILLHPRVGQLICEGDCHYLYRQVRSGWQVVAGAPGARLPRIRPRIGEIYRPAVLTLPRLRGLRRMSPPGELDMDRFLSLLDRELTHALGEEIHVEEAPGPAQAHGLFAADGDPFAAVAADLRRLQMGWWRPEGRIYIRWHAAIRALIPGLRLAYGMMDPAQRSRFDGIFSRGYLDAFAAMPDVTAGMLLAFRDAGVLDVKPSAPTEGYAFVLTEKTGDRSFSDALADLRQSLIGN